MTGSGSIFICIKNLYMVIRYIVDYVKCKI